MLKYLKIKRFSDHMYTTYESECPTKKVTYLKQLIIDYSKANFEDIERLLKRIPNLIIFTINAPDEPDMFDANRWQHLIESSLPHVSVFNFYFGLISTHCYHGMENKIQQFQTNFWCEEHHWYTNYEIDWDGTSIYTIPYVWNEYSLIHTCYKYNISNGFDNVTKLSLVTVAVKDNSPYYFKNIKSLTLVKPDIDFTYEPEEWMLNSTQIKFLNKIVNLSNIQHLAISDAHYMLSSSLLVEILKELPYISSLQIDKFSLISFIKDHELRKYLNRKINVLSIIDIYLHYDIESDDVDLLCEIFSNLEQLHCYPKDLDVLLLILRKFSKLSMINSGNISKDTYSWIQINASNLNVYIDFNLIGGKPENFI